MALTLVNPTLLDLSRRLDPNDKIARIVEILAQRNEVLQDMVFKEGNLLTGEKTTVRTGLPTATWRKLNYGVPNAKGTTRQITDSCGMLESYAEVDKALADLNGNSSDWRLSEDMAFMEGMNQQMASTLFYGDTSVNPERFMGLAPRFNTISTDPLLSGYQILSGSGATASAETSVWLVVWGFNSVYGIYPNGSKMGFQHNDLGEQTLLDANNGKYQGYRTHYKWDCGLVVRDWRNIVRIANIKTADLTKNAASGADLIDLMVQATELVDNLNIGKAVFYCNRKVRSFLRRQMMNKSNVLLSLDEVAGKKVMAFDGIPVRRTDAITNTEGVVS